MHVRRVFVLIWAVVSVASVAGCAGRSSIPSGAQNVASGLGKLRFAAPENGKVYLLDVDRNVKVFESKIRRGDEMMVEPSQDRIVVAGDNERHAPPLKADHRYRIYFDRAQ